MARTASGSVPLVRRLLVAHPARTAAGSLGIGLALMLILLLDGLWAGVQGRVTTYEDHAGADIAVVAPGTDNLFADRGCSVACPSGGAPSSPTAAAEA